MTHIAPMTATNTAQAYRAPSARGPQHHHTTRNDLERSYLLGQRDGLAARPMSSPAATDAAMRAVYEAGYELGGLMLGRRAVA